jgi:hypothetical protein
MSWLGKNIKGTKLESIDAPVDIPLTSDVAWFMYPKYNWVYSTSRLLEMQNIDWSPLYMPGKSWAVPEMTDSWKETKKFSPVDYSASSTPGQPLFGHIFITPMVGERLTTDVAVLKGEMKWAAHHTVDEQGNRTLVDGLRGDVELRISALTTLHFRKFAGVISVDTIGHDIVCARLHMTADMVDQYEADWLKKVIRIYNRRPWGK